MQGCVNLNKDNLVKNNLIYSELQEKTPLAWWHVYEYQTTIKNKAVSYWTQLIPIDDDRVQVGYRPYDYIIERE